MCPRNLYRHPIQMRAKKWTHCSNPEVWIRKKIAGEIHEKSPAKGFEMSPDIM